MPCQFLFKDVCLSRAVEILNTSSVRISKVKGILIFFLKCENVERKELIKSEDKGAKEKID